MPCQDWITHNTIRMQIYFRNTCDVNSTKYVLVKISKYAVVVKYNYKLIKRIMQYKSVKNHFRELTFLQVTYAIQSRTTLSLLCLSNPSCHLLLFESVSAAFQHLYSIGSS